VSYSVDVNVLVYASDESSPLHERASGFLNRCSADPEPLCLGWPTIMAYVRIVTHPRIFGHPLTPSRATRNVDSLLGLPQVRVLSEKDGFWDRYRRLTGTFTVRGNLVPDAHLAALLLQHDVRVLYTRDGDFKKFGDLEVRDPFSG